MSVITCRSNQLRGTGEPTPRGPQHSVYTYLGGIQGEWEVTHSEARRGEPLASVSRIEIQNGPVMRLPAGTNWMLSGPVQHTRYVTREDVGARSGNRAPASPMCAALIAIRHSPEWWRIPADAPPELSATFSGLHVRRLLSTVMSRWQHSRDLSGQFERVTWFEYEACDASAFEDLLAEWRASAEWKTVDRECALRLVRAPVTSRPR